MSTPFLFFSSILILLLFPPSLGLIACHPLRRLLHVIFTLNASRVFLYLQKKERLEQVAYKLEQDLALCKCRGVHPLTPFPFPLCIISAFAFRALVRP